MLTVNDIKDEKLKDLLYKYRYTQIVEDQEYDRGVGPSLDGAIRDASDKEHNLVEYLKSKFN